MTDSDSTKRCSMCEQIKPVSGFGRNAGASDGLRSSCLECTRRSRRERYATDSAYRSKMRAAIQDWEMANSERNKEYRRRWYAENLDRQEEYRKTAYKRHGTRFSHAYKARKTGAGGEYTPEQFHALCEFYNHTCLCCGWRGKMTFDHVVPLSRGGGNTILNAQPLCGSCNGRKHAKSTDYRDLAEFMTFIDQLKTTGLLGEL